MSSSMYLDPTVFDGNLRQDPNRPLPHVPETQPGNVRRMGIKPIVTLVSGVVLVAGAIFLCLAAYQVLPSGVNCISQLGKWGPFISYSLLGSGVIISIIGYFSVCGYSRVVHQQSFVNNPAIRPAPDPEDFDSYDGDDASVEDEAGIKQGVLEPRIDGLDQLNGANLTGPEAERFAELQAALDVWVNESQARYRQPIAQQILQCFQNQGISLN